MSQSPIYAQLLRPVGQMLEALEVESFVLRVEGDDFLIRGEKKAPKRQEEEKGLRVVWQILSQGRGQKSDAGSPSSGAVELRYKPEDISRMEGEGRSRRRTAGQTPDAQSLSQILRSVGAFVDHKTGRFLGVTKQDQNLTIEYETALGRVERQEMSISNLYDFWVRMYLKRGGRASR